MIMIMMITMIIMMIIVILLLIVLLILVMITMILIMMIITFISQYNITHLNQKQTTKTIMIIIINIRLHQISSYWEFVQKASPTQDFTWGFDYEFTNYDFENKP